MLGVNGQILMHYAAFLGIEWFDYLELMRRGIDKHGQVRAGVYAMTGGGDAVYRGRTHSNEPRICTGVLSHAPGITGRAHLVKNTTKNDDRFYAKLDRQRQDIEDSGADAH